MIPKFSPIDRIKKLFVLLLLVVYIVVMSASILLVSSIVSIYEENIVEERNVIIYGQIENTTIDYLITEDRPAVFQQLNILVDSIPSLVEITLRNEDKELISTYKASNKDSLQTSAAHIITKEFPVIFEGENFGSIEFSRDYFDEIERLNDRIIKQYTLYLLAMAVLLSIVLMAIYSRVRPLFARILYLSLHDPLTNIANRRNFDEVIAQKFSASQHLQTSVGFILVDIDNFKAYNDIYGHEMGDQCLQKVAQCLSATAHRGSDIVARIGGEEFGIFISGEAKQVAKLAEKCRAAVADLKIDHQGSKASGIVTISIGYTVLIPNLNENTIDLYKMADKALYMAKENGRNCILSCIDTRDSRALR